MKNENKGIMSGLLSFLAITSALFVSIAVDNTPLASKAVAQSYPNLQPFPSTSQLQQPQRQPPNTAAISNGNNNNNLLQNLQNQIDQLKGYNK